MSWHERVRANAVIRKVAIGAFVSVLSIGCAGLAACDNQKSEEAGGAGSAVEEVVSTAPETYVVALEAPAGSELIDALRNDEAQADLAAKVASAEVSVDDEARVVSMDVVVDGGDVEELTACAEALASELSDRAQVTAADGSAASDDGPCGALYQAYDLIARVYNGTTGEFFDGTLPAGGDEVMWQ